MPEGLLTDKIVLVTGASKGIGAATARVCASFGAAVVLVARSADAISAVANEITNVGGRALAVPTDVTDAQAAQEMVEAAIAEFGRLDGAFNNAGIGHMPTPVADLDVEGFDLAMSTVRGVFLSMKFEVAAMKAAGGGSIVNTSSTAGLQGVRGMAGYSAAKHGVVGLTKSAAIEYAGDSIRVNAVAPGPILNERLAALDETQLERVSAAVPMGRLGNPEEVGGTVAWLLSDLSSFVTGAVISVDGGRLAGQS